MSSERRRDILSETCVPEDDINCQIGARISEVVFPCLLTIGTLGNFFALVVLCRKSLRQQISFTCFLILCVVDLLYLWSGVYRPSIRYIFGIQIQSKVSAISCEIVRLVGYSSQSISSNIIAIIAVERSLTVWFPLVYRRNFNRKACLCVILVLSGFFITVDSFMVFGFEAFTLPNSTTMDQSTCHVVSPSFGTYMRYWPLRYFLFNALLPIGVVVICNYLLIRKLFEHRRIMNDLSQTRSSSSVTSSTTKLVIVISAFYIVTVTPFFLFVVYANISGVTDDNFTRLKVAGDTLYLLLLCNHTFNFTMYFWTGGKFRRECRIMVLKIRQYLTGVTIMHKEMSSMLNNSGRASSRKMKAVLDTELQEVHVPDCASNTRGCISSDEMQNETATCAGEPFSNISSASKTSGRQARERMSFKSCTPDEDHSGKMDAIYMITTQEQKGNMNRVYDRTHHEPCEKMTNKVFNTVVITSYLRPNVNMTSIFNTTDQTQNENINSIISRSDQEQGVNNTLNVSAQEPNGKMDNTALNNSAQEQNVKMNTTVLNNLAQEPNEKINKNVLYNSDQESDGDIISVLKTSDQEPNGNMKCV